MKNEKRKRAAVTALMLTMLFGFATGAAGTDDDPLISLSYITNVVMPYIDEAVSSNGSAFEVVEVPKGKTVNLGASTEAILRSGDGTVVLSSGAAGGFTDVTNGRDTLAGEAVLANHHLVCPRNDGRGIKAESKLYIMIKGAYDIR